MLKAVTITKPARHLTKMSVITLALVFSVNVLNIFAQDDLRDTVYGNPKKQTPEKPRASKKKPKVLPVQDVSPGVPRNVPNQRKSPPKTYVDVTFISREPAVEVYINDRSIGSTNEKFELSKKMAAGEYQLMAKTKRQVLLPTRRINITPELATVKLFEESLPKPAPKVEEPSQPEEKSEQQKMLETSEQVRKILENYANPATTDAVTTDDWQVVFQAAQFGLLQGYTAVQIEAQRWFASGQIELAKGDFPNAFTAFNKAQEFMPTSALPFYGLGNTYFADKKYPDALKLYQKALQIDPKLAVAYKKLGDTQRISGREKEAIAAYKNAIQHGYKTLETRFWLGTLLLNTKQIEEAVKELEKIAAEMPKAEVFISIGAGYEKLKRDVSAIEAYQKAIEADPDSALSYYKLANVYLSQREYTKAKEAFEKAISLDPEGKSFNKTEAQKKLREASEKLNK